MSDKNIETLRAELQANAAALEAPWTEWLRQEKLRADAQLPDTQAHLLEGNRTLMAIGQHFAQSIDGYKALMAMADQLRAGAESELAELKTEGANTTSVEARINRLQSKRQIFEQWAETARTHLTAVQEWSHKLDNRLASTMPVRIGAAVFGSTKPN